MLQRIAVHGAGTQHFVQQPFHRGNSLLLDLDQSFIGFFQQARRYLRRRGEQLAFPTDGRLRRPGRRAAAFRRSSSLLRVRAGRPTLRRPRLDRGMLRSNRSRTSGHPRIGGRRIRRAGLGGRHGLRAGSRRTRVRAGGVGRHSGVGIRAGRGRLRLRSWRGRLGGGGRFWSGSRRGLLRSGRLRAGSRSRRIRVRAGGVGGYSGVRTRAGRGGLRFGNWSGGRSRCRLGSRSRCGLRSRRGRRLRGRSRCGFGSRRGRGLGNWGWRRFGDRGRCGLRSQRGSRFGRRRGGRLFRDGGERLGSGFGRWRGLGNLARGVGASFSGSEKRRENRNERADENRGAQQRDVMSPFWICAVAVLGEHLPLSSLCKRLPQLPGKPSQVLGE